MGNDNDVFCACLTPESSDKYAPRREKTCPRGFANNKDVDQPAHPRRLISAFLFAYW